MNTYTCYSVSEKITVRNCTDHKHALKKMKDAGCDESLLWRIECWVTSWRKTDGYWINDAVVTDDRLDADLFESLASASELLTPSEIVQAIEGIS